MASSAQRLQREPGRTPYPSPAMPWLPILADVLAAKRVIARTLPRTPLIEVPSFREQFGFDLFLKVESVLPTGAFKVRGGLFLMDRLPAEQKAKGVVTASTGNHGQSIAFAARAAQVTASIFVPEGANPAKVASMQQLGANVVFAGNDFADSCRAAEAFAAENGAYYVHPANEPCLIAGVGTYTLEILEDLPDAGALFVAIGGGSGVSGACLVGKAINPGLAIYGVQATGAPAAYEGWRQRKLVTLDRTDTFAEGVATREAMDLPSRIFWDKVDAVTLVSDQELKRSMVTLLERAHIVAEGAGAAALAGAISRADQLQGKKVVCVVSGGNVTLSALKAIVNEEQPW